MSVDDIIIVAQIAENESTPQLSIIALYDAKEAPKDNGLVTISGKISEGIPRALNKGERNSDNISIAPEAKSILTPTTKRQIDGRSPKTDFKPCVAPFKKWDKISFFEKRKIIDTSKITRGKT